MDKALGETLSVLNERERNILKARRLVDDPITLEDLAAEFGVSRERVRQIEVRAFEKVQKAVKARLMAFRGVSEKSDLRHRWLLRERPEGPSGSRAAERRDELAQSHARHGPSS